MDLLYVVVGVKTFPIEASQTRSRKEIATKEGDQDLRWSWQNAERMVSDTNNR